MVIHTFTPTEYRNCPIYIRQFMVGHGECFEYLTVINNQIYTFQVAFSLKPLRRFIGLFKKQPYSQVEIKNAIEYMTKVAQTTIDSVLGEYKAPKDGLVLSPLQRVDRPES